MKEARIISWCDMHLSEGERVEATSTVVFGFNGLVRQDDLCSRHRADAEKLLRPYLDAGTKPEKAPATPGGSAHRGYNYRPGAKQRKQDLRDWADAQVKLDPSLAERYNYITDSGNYYYPIPLKDDYREATGIDIDAVAGT